MNVNKAHIWILWCGIIVWICFLPVVDGAIEGCRGSNIVLPSQDQSENIKSTSIIKWTKDRKLINLSRDKRFEMIADGSLMIDNIDASDSGHYIMMIDENEVLHYNLIIPDTRFHTTRGKMLSFVKNDRAVLKVESQHDGTFMWYFQGKKLPKLNISNHYKFPDPLHYGIVNGTVLEIHRIQPRHSGLYNITLDVKGCQNSIAIVVKVTKQKNDTGLFSYVVILSKLMKDKIKKKKPFTILIVLAVVVSSTAIVLLAVFCVDIIRKIRKKSNKNVKKDLGKKSTEE